MLTFLSGEEGWRQFGELTSSAFLEDMRSELCDHSCSYAVPVEASRQTCLSIALAKVATTEPIGFLCITGWGSAPQNMDLFDGYRRSIGEGRSLFESPIHAFSPEDLKQVECLLDMILYFSWDCFLFDRSFQYLITVNHDEYMDVHCPDDESLLTTLSYFEDLNLDKLE